MNPTAWSDALLATAVISMVPIALLGLFSCCWRQWSTQSRLNILLAFSVGGLLGDTFLHLIPHAMAPHDHHSHDTHDHHHHHDTQSMKSSFDAAVGMTPNDPTRHHDHHDHNHHHHDHHDHSHADDHVHDNSLGLLIIAGIFIFMLIEKGMRLYRHRRGLADHGHSHGGHAHAHPEHTAHISTDALATNGTIGSKVDNNGLRQRAVAASATNTKPFRQVVAPFTFDNGSDEPDTATQVAAAIVAQAAVAHDDNTLEVSESAKSAMWLGLLSDFIHNVTDGMAIAASFLVSRQVGLTTTAAVLFHEVPHELGDYALSIAGGMTTGRAIKFQLLTALGALLGCLVVLWSGGTSGTFGAAILPVTAGGFIYLALVDVMPTLQEDLSLRHTFAQVAAMSLGVGMMYIVGLFE